MTDGAGNVSVQGYDLEVINHPPVTATPTPVAHAHAGRRPPRPTAVPSTAVLTPAKRYAVTRRGALTRRGELPGARRDELPRVSRDAARQAAGPQAAATIATRAHVASSRARRRSVTLKLSAGGAACALARRSLRATLTLAGAKPADRDAGALGTLLAATLQSHCADATRPFAGVIRATPEYLRL